MKINEHDLTYKECVEEFGEEGEYSGCINECAEFIQDAYPKQSIDICQQIMDLQVAPERFSDTYSRLKWKRPALFY